MAAPPPCPSPRGAPPPGRPPLLALSWAQQIRGQLGPKATLKTHWLAPVKVKFWARLGKQGGLPGGDGVSPEKEERAGGSRLQWGGKWQVGEDQPF